MASDFDMPHEIKFDFVSFPLFGFSLVINWKILIWEVTEIP